MLLQLCSSSCASRGGGEEPLSVGNGAANKVLPLHTPTTPQPSHPPSSSCVAQFGMRDTGCGSGPKRGLRGAVRGGGSSLRRSALSICVGIVSLQRDSSRPIGSTERETLWWRRAADPFRGVWDTKPFGLC